jgi:hypothetical protein
MDVFSFIFKYIKFISDPKTHSEYVFIFPRPTFGGGQKNQPQALQHLRANARKLTIKLI